MNSFLKDVLLEFLNRENTALDQITFVLPSKRAGSYLKNILRSQTDYSGFVPEILSIEELASKITGLTALDHTHTLFRFYETYSKLTPKESKEDFDIFYGWAQTLVQDFNEIDRFLVPTDSLFNYLSEIKNIEHWSLAQPQTKLIKNYLNFWNNLSKYHSHFVEDLLQKKEAYQGLNFRQAANQIEDYLNQHNNHLVFIGFNALNKAEQKIIQKVLSKNRGEVFWDIDTYFLENEIHQAGRFIRNYKNTWKTYTSQNHSFNRATNSYQNSKKIEIIGIPKNIGQAKYAGTILENIDLQNTAVILNDEGLLFPLLNSLPEKADKVNITMGLALSKTPPYSLFKTIFKIQQDSSDAIYFKNVLDILTHPVIKRVMKDEASGIREEIVSKNIVYLNPKDLIEKASDQHKELFEICFSNFKNQIPDFLTSLIRLTELLRPQDAQRWTLETQYLYHFYKVFIKIYNLLKKHNPLTSIKSFERIYQDVLQTEVLDFSGSPFDGLQIMGMLESRVLDFKNIILTSVNEGILPGGKSVQSFIPYDLKRQYGLPTYSEKDAVYTYHFYRLLQRAENIYLLYNSETAGTTSKEKSRFITQIEVDNLDAHIISQKLIQPKTNPHQKKEEIGIPKTPEILEILKKQAKKGFSPSALTTYIRNPLDFYKRYVLGIGEKEEVEETIAATTLGTVVHDTLEAFYKPLEGKEVSRNEIENMIEQIDSEVEKQFFRNYSELPLKSGKNLIIFEVAKRFVYNFLRYEQRQLKRNPLKILHIENDILKQEIPIPELDFPVSIRGKVDRVDQFGEQVRIIDYKTGKVEKRNLSLEEPELLIEDVQYNQAFQILCYTSMLQQKRDLQNIQAGIISFRNLKEGFLPFNYKDEATGKDSRQIDEKVLDLFHQELKNLIKEIFDPTIDFKEKEN